jgi:hypothetical protein
MAKNEAFREILEEYRQSYDVDSLATPNDRANLDTIIMNTLALKQLQDRLLQLTVDEVVDNAPEIKKINDSIVALSDLNLRIERQLGIDRKTRKSESEQSVVEYITWLKSMAVEYLDNNSRLFKVYCKKCQIMVGRISGVYETTAYNAEFQCPQCQKMIRIERKEKDIFFDIKDADWRRKYPMEIVQPSVIADTPDLPPGDDELLLGTTAAYDEDE